MVFERNKRHTHITLQINSIRQVDKKLVQFISYAHIDKELCKIPFFLASNFACEKAHATTMIMNVVFNIHTYEGRFYVRRVVDLMKTTEVNAYIMYIFGKIELLSIDAI